jgi:oligopeptidase B
MQRTSLAFLFAGWLALASGVPTLHRPALAADTSPPVARIVPKIFEEFGQKRIDNYDWLRDRDDPQVVAHLHAENAYADARLKAIQPLVNALSAELKAREADEDASVPFADNGYLYERRFAKGAQYPVIVRRRDAPDAAAEVVLDVEALAAGHAQYRLLNWRVSPDNRRVAFAVDFVGNRQFRIFVRDIATGRVDDQGIDGAAANFVFAADSETLFYVRNEAQTLRPYQVWRHRVGAPASGDVLAYEEKDPTFSVALDRSKSRKFIFIEIDQERTSEFRYLPADRPTDEFSIIEPRRHGVRYGVDHVGDRFFIRTNVGAPDYRLVSAPQETPGAAHWSELIAHRPGRYLGRFEVFEKFLAVDEEREVGTVIRVFRLSDMREITVPRPAEIGVASTFFFGGIAGNREASSTVLRFRFTGPLQPQRIYDLDMASGALTLRKQDPASRWFSPEPYALARIEAVAPDGARVPVTLVYRKALRRSGGGNPTLIVAYGAYGFSVRPAFASSIFGLIDRGFVYAIAHVRGGRERGERWYDEGRVLNKRNSFTDFIAVTETLIAQGYADRKAVFAQGRSAGGLLVGAVANMRPELYAGIVAEVPFVDVVTTMSDPSIPLTTLEYEEWGNPAVKPQYDYMRSYSPYDNVARRDYPAMFVTAGFHDSQVSYAEPAKWVARLRANTAGGRDILFKTEMGAGHGGRSGRLGSITESAEIMAWLLARAAAARAH